MIKKLYRESIGLIAMSPFILVTKISSVFIGKEKTVEFCGPYLTSIGKVILKLIYLPKIKDESEFDLFKSKMKAKSRFWKPLFDFSFAYEDNDTIQLNIKNCPFCESLIKCGCSELAPYVCQGDWEVAKDYSNLWSFDRKNQIGTGDNFCDHTYKRTQI